MKTILSIAGSDSSGGAGIQADLKTFTVHGVYGMSVITAVTAQNTCGIYDILNVPVSLVISQLDAVFTDIFPDAVKIGMVSTADIIEAIARQFRDYKPGNVVIDPVMVATSGRNLLDRDALLALTNTLFPYADIITPNIPEAEILCGFKIYSKEDMMKAAQFLGERYCKNVLIKGGHLSDSSDDLLFHDGKITWFAGRRIETNNTHGTGCTLSSAITANLAKGTNIETAVRKSKEFVANALSSGLDLGKGNGPLNHCF